MSYETQEKIKNSIICKPKGSRITRTEWINPKRINRSREFFANRESLNSGMAFNLDMINIIAKEFNISPKYFMPDEGL